MKNHTSNLIVAFFFLAPIAGQQVGSAADAIKRPSRAVIANLREQMQAGPEHDKLATFSGDWELSIRAGRDDHYTGTASTRMILENRFLVIDYNARSLRSSFAGSFTLGFDRRHAHYTLIAMDTSGTYYVTSKGQVDSKTGKIKLYGKDDDPYMRSLGHEKEFGHAIDFSRTDQFSIEVIYIDTRTPERQEKSGMLFTFQKRPTAAQP